MAEAKKQIVDGEWRGVVEFMRFRPHRLAV